MNKKILGAALLASLMCATGVTAVRANDTVKAEANACASQEDKDAVAKGEKEKCYGVVKAGKNDCAAKDGSNSCAGQSKADSSANDWVFLPTGVCDKLVGGQKG